MAENGQTRTETKEQPAAQNEPERVDVRPDVPRPGTWWTLVLAGALALIIGIGALEALRYLGRPLALLALGTAIAAAFAPLVTWLQRWLPRTVAIVVIYVVLALALALVSWMAVPPLVAQAQEAASRLPDLIQRGQAWLNQQGWFGAGGLPSGVTDQFNSLAGTLVGLPVRLFSSVFETVLVLFISIYALIEAPHIDRFLISLVPRPQQGRTETVLHKMAQAMGGYLRGTAINGAILGVLAFIGLVLLRVRYPLVLAVLTALLELIPIVGPVVAGALMTGTALLQSPGQALAVLIFVTVLQQTETHLLLPNVMHRQTNISPLVAVLALVAGGALGGILGALIGIPLAAALRVFVGQVVAPAIRRWTGAARQPEEA